MTTEHELKSATLYRRLWHYLRRYLGVFCISLTAMALAAATEPLFVTLMKPLLDEAFVNKNLDTMLWMAPAILGLFLLRGVMSIINEYTSSWLTGHLVQTLRQELFARLIRLPVSYYENNTLGRMISRITSDVNQITDAGFNVITVTVRDGVVIVGLFGVLLLTDWQLTLICFTVFPAVVLCIQYVRNRMRRLSRESQKQMGQLQQILHESIVCQRVVKIFNGAPFEEQRFARCAKDIRHNNIKQNVTRSVSTALTQFIIAIALCAVLYFAVMRASQNAITAGDFVKFVMGMLMIFAPMKRITNISQSLQRGLAAAESVFSFLDEHQEPDTGTHVLKSNAITLAFDRVSFRYPNAPQDALQEISLTVNAGETLALVGQSGSGKTTLVGLIPRFHLPSSGNIYINDIPIGEITLASLRDHIALVSQDVVLFNDTIAANIAYGTAASVTPDAIENAARAANALEFIDALPERFDTLIGENGVRLSGGQRQRLAIARALLKNAPILILDEATSALDTQSERSVQSALDHLMKNRTTIVIAHRLSTIENADKIAVMREGELVEFGTHQDLLQKNGVYATLHRLQFGKN
ncbi:MAG: lipid A export permease/ATP-binding protein MsbA [Burkholderiales bacterium]|jgi:subfamily B ATP-binding cassette protein MsbA|nr:lipid A export permease/ATP-binding protein MsbA [Burkholderiales bacterium]